MKIHPVDEMAVTLLKTAITVAVLLTAVGLLFQRPMHALGRRLRTTDLVHAIPLALFAGLGHLLIGNVDVGLLGQLLLGSIPGVIVGAMLSARLPHGLLRGVLSVVWVSVGGMLAWSVVGN